MKRLIHTLLCPLLCMVLILSLIPVTGTYAVSQTSVNTEEAFYVVGSCPVFQTGWDELIESNRLQRSGDEWVITFEDVPMGYWEFAVTNGSEYWGNPYDDDDIERFLAQGGGDMEISFDPVEENMYFAYTYEPALPVPPMTIYCRAPEDWNSCYAFWGGSVNTCTEKIGEPMDDLGDNLWSLEVYSDITYVTFTNGQGQQRSTNIPYNDEMLYDYTCDCWESPVEINQLSTVRVVGNASFMGNWDVSSDAGRMTRIGENLHEVHFRDVAPGHYEFRVTADANWNRFWSQGEENYTVDITQTTDLVITLQSDIWGEGSVSIYQGAGAPSENCYYVAGPGELCGIDWMPDAEENRMQYLGDGIWSKTYYDVAPGYYEIKITDGTWDHIWPIPGLDDNTPYFQLPTNGDVTIQFNEYDGSVTYLLSEDESSVQYYVVGNASFMGDWDTESDQGLMVSENHKYVKRFYNVPAGAYEFCIVEGITWDVCWNDNGVPYKFELEEPDDILIAFDPDSGLVQINHDPICRVVGNADCFGNWDPMFEDGKMEQVGATVYKKMFYDVPAGHYEILVTRDGCFEADIAPYEFEVPQTQSIQITFDNSSGSISVEGSIRSLDPSEDNENTDPGNTLSLKTLIILKSILQAFDFNNDGHFCLEDLINLWTRFQQIP